MIEKERDEGRRKSARERRERKKERQIQREQEKRLREEKMHVKECIKKWNGRRENRGKRGN